MRKSVLLLVLMAITAGITGCSHAGHTNKFSIVDGTAKIKEGTIAVIAGSGDEKDIKLAREITRLLKERTAFKVMEQKEIEERIPLYPGYFIEKQGVETDNWSISGNYLSENNQAAVNKIQESLKTQYVIVVWTERLGFVVGTGCSFTAPFGLMGGDFFRIMIPVRLVAYPQKKVVAHCNTVYESYYSQFRPFNSSIDKLLVSAAEETVKNFQAVLETGQAK
ncbi:MAG: hypothetical protein CVV44_01775 [Spirochaetae bacterium HGW-Spirochaetae-1]|nr:MAG: hypothetical protein CVV44_01775 [Spirochaetae bacterium HGW-Spirochaetae-1]